MQTDRFKKIIRTRKNINIQDLSLTSTFQNYTFIFFLKKNYITKCQHSLGHLG